MKVATTTRVGTGEVTIADPTIGTLSATPTAAPPSAAQRLGYDFIQGPMGAWNFAGFGATAA